VLEPRIGYAGYVRAEWTSTVSFAINLKGSFSGVGGNWWLARNRFYDPLAGRWINRDPAGYIDGLSMYLYVRANPWGLVDPMGLEGWVPGWIHIGLDIVGCIPVVGEPADAANAALHLTEGNYVDAGLSAVSCVPVVGDVIGKGGKIIRYSVKAANAADAAADTVKATTKAVDAVQAGDKAKDAVHAREAAAGTAKASDQAGDTGKVADEATDAAKVLDEAGDAGKAGKTVAPKGGTYKLKDPETHAVRRTGQTNDLDRRKKEHARGKETEDLEFEVDRRSDSEPARRGREQRLYDQHPEADLNKKRPIAPRNPKRDNYLREGDKLK
ncbi:MAG: RHS repeat-associated core domain-containing protein, partial [Phycisphaerales bacterium]|nr:RHS repeat-associated core domain-containing protein [Phycisphaerales bacterium]